MRSEMRRLSLMASVRWACLCGELGGVAASGGVIWVFNVRDAFPVFALPLRDGAEGPLLDLKPLLDGVYERAGFGLRVDYGAVFKPEPSGNSQICLAELWAFEGA